MQAYREKRTFDERKYDFVCVNLLPAGATIASIVGVTADQGGFTFGTPVINNVPNTYPDGTTAPIGTVIQVEISGGTIGSNDSMQFGYPNLLCTLRAQFTTSQSPDQIEANGLLLLVDQPR